VFAIMLFLLPIMRMRAPMHIILRHLFAALGALQLLLLMLQMLRRWRRLLMLRLLLLLLLLLRLLVPRGWVYLRSSGPVHTSIR
jgi:hypothetical protein